MGHGDSLELNVSAQDFGRLAGPEPQLSGDGPVPGSGTSVVLANTADYATVYRISPPGFFSHALGVTGASRRLPTRARRLAGRAARPVIIPTAFWRQRFNADPNADRLQPSRPATAILSPSSSAWLRAAVSLSAAGRRLSCAAWIAPVHSTRGRATQLPRRRRRLNDGGALERFRRRMDILSIAKRRLEQQYRRALNKRTQRATVASR
jgi:hypothetical protein